MSTTTHPDRIHKNVRQPPLTDEEMGQMWRKGEPMSYIAHAARRRNGLSIAEVRAIVHRVCGLVDMGAGR
ncbi:hypothetical protein [Sphingopyxis flava]|uniref:GcrA cell cycle regulator n=1 Tax=Sphingopyxis flava TaxID=1507287 RepID=A0A1T5ABJ0_9SPHN|nr:hypothetical protein [Sphingopyxis flava]SKB32189.1 hypothetical protein SAMN06295937_100354 [Sphingopyxis flava]